MRLQENVRETNTFECFSRKQACLKGLRAKFQGNDIFSEKKIFAKFHKKSKKISLNFETPRQWNRHFRFSSTHN
jgi:hypothetical protein